ncbi:MAG: DNA repair protein RecO [Candidatus Caldatribacteriota bacterium]|nr:DNA repair protein RecO [Candidatus Caldatribacteriota bacterium]
MLYKTEGIVIKSTEYRDADKILSIYTKNYGKITAIAKGVRKTKSKFGSSLELLTHSIFLIYKGRNIDIINQTEILESFFPISKQFIKFAFAINCAEVINKLCEDRETNRDLFFLLKETLHLLKTAKEPKLLSLSFKWKVLNIIGYRPSLDRCSGCNKKMEDMGGIFFRIDEGVIACSECIIKDKSNYVKVSDYFIRLLRKILVTPLSVISKTAIHDKRIEELGKITNIYLDYYSDSIFKTDGFLKKLAD